VKRQTTDQLLLRRLWRIILGARTQWHLGAGTAQVFHFGDFTLDQSRYRLQRGERILRLERQPMELLFLLVERRGELVTREEVADRLWGTTVFVDIDQSINTAVRKVRMVLRDDPDKPRFIETVVGKGYRFATPVAVNGEATVSAMAGLRALPQPAHASQSAVAAAHAQRMHRRPPVVMLLAGIGAVLAIFASGWMAIHVRNTRSSTHPSIKSLVVLPLKNLSGDPAQEYLADGMTEALVSRLSGIHDLRVISRTSSMHLKNSNLSVPEIANALQIDVVVEGSVIREGNRIRVTAQLIRGTTDEHFWSETYDRELPDVLALQSDVAQAIARKVEVTVTGKEEQRLTASHTVLPEVYESYLKGRSSLSNNNTKAGIEERIRYFEEAIAKDPAFAPAYVGLAEAHADLGTVMMGEDPNRERPKVVSAVRRALELDPNLAEAHVLLAEMAQEQWRWAEAETEYRRALELNPNDSDGYAGLADWLLCKGRTDEALASAERARELDRLGSTTSNIAWILFQSRRYEEAVRELRSSLAVHPNGAGSLWLLGFTLVINGQASEAIPLLERAAALADGSSGFIDVLGAAYARAGRRADALRILAELKRRKQHGYVAAASFVIVYLGLGENEQAFAWLEEAYKERSNMLQFVKVHPLFDPLRGDPRFADLLHRVGLG
jgi:TolB-like protein/DNA-binding winged helix-turn-helix (wHTH) protein/tetratricopeptide (TPR) repeat protein